MKRAGLLLLGLAAVIAAASATVRAADVADADLAQIKKDIGKLLGNQTLILQELKDIRAELDVVRIRCSS